MSDAPRSPPDTVAAGLGAGMPIVLGYVPAAFAFGAAAVGAGFAAGEATAISAIVFSGANQVFLLAALAAGTPLGVVVALGALAGLRHVLYGVVLRRRVGGTRAQRLAFAWGLTDEAFAVALGRTQDGVRPGGRWLIGLAIAAYGAWVAGTVAGALAGGALAATSARAAAAMAFALPALFLALAVSAVRRPTFGPMTAAAALAGAALATGHGDLAIPLGALGAVIARQPA